jgi:hypothetical protein
MVRVAIAWNRRTSANKVGLSKAIGKHPGAGLAQAKQFVDRCLQAETIVVTACAESHADDLIATAGSLGWSAWIVEEREEADA